MRHYEESTHINVGTGIDQSIHDLALLVRDVVYPGAQLVFETSKPDGAPRKLLDVSRIHALGWRHRIGLAVGVAGAYRWFLENHDTARGAVTPVSGAHA